ncbi:MAG: TolC family protein [Myxococcales bacterium]|nr:TolC family protein [Myxococcales bacterium]MBK7194493.1 TolC family protein [Myxococcales bacterium]
MIGLARSSSPSVRVARTAVDEERADLIGARIFARDNPVLEAVAGPRWGDETSIDLEATLAIPIELGGKRRKRIAAAQAAIERASAEVAAGEQEAISRALRAYYAALHAQERVRLAEERKRLADQLLDAARSRLEAGDIAELEVNLAATEVARAESEVLAEAADVERARGELAIILGLDGPDAAVVVGALGERGAFDALQPSERADVTAARVAIDEEQAAVVSADAARFPDFNVRVTYSREDGGTDIVLAGLAFTLPLFDRGQGERAAARARVRRAELALELTEDAIATEVEVATRAYRTSVASVMKLEEDALPLVQRNEQLSVTAYQSGKADIGTVILVRREALETRHEYLKRQLEAALAGVELSRALGVLR